MDPLPVTAWSVLPPVVAFALALGTRRVGLALAGGGLCGTVLIAALGGAGPLAAIPLGVLDFVRIGILGRVSEASNAQLLVLIALIGGFVHLLEVSGAARALTSSLAHRVRSPRGGMLATWVGGLVLFFSDMGNVLILGPVFRPLYDRLAVPREVLAWVIDTTAAPISVMIPFIAWGVYAIGLIEAALDGLPVAAVAAAVPGRIDAAGAVDGLGVFLDAMGLQMYPLLSLLFVPLMLAVGRPVGPMARCRAHPGSGEDGADPHGLGPAPALVALGVLFAVMLAVGVHTLQVDGRITGSGVRVGLASAYLAAIGALVAMLHRRGAADRAAEVVRGGMGRSMPLLVLLVLAWTLGEVCARMGTGALLASAIGDALPPGWLPVAVFAVGAVTSFATGTSWGTFAILMPIALPLAVALGADGPTTVAAVLSGGVFGDHCSPISDTTLLASMGAGTDHADHVATQLPYASMVGGAAAVAFVVAGLAGGGWGLGIGASITLVAVIATRVYGASHSWALSA